MKKVIIALAALLTVQTAVAQIKSEEAKKAIEAAEAAAANPKKNTKLPVWMKLASAYMDAYNVPAGNIWTGAQQVEVQMILGSQKPSSVENVVLGGEQYTKEIYADKNLYYNGAGILSVIEVTKPVIEGALDKALEAYRKAYKIDVSRSKVKDIAAGFQSVAQKYMDEGMNEYTFGRVAEASVLFEKAADINLEEPLEILDTSAYYNAAYTAWISGNNDRALSLFTKCYDNGYYYENGEVFAKLADIYGKKGETEKMKAILEEGFQKFPQSQSILIGLINYYLDGGQDTDKLFSLLDEAKKNEPTNGSLYYVEGNIHKQLGETEEAVKSYLKAAEIDPTYEFGYIGCGVLYYEKAIEISEKAANEFDDAKYMALVEEFEACLMNAIEPFEKAYQISKDDSIKVNISEYLKNIYFRFRDKDAKYQAAYEKYEQVMKTGVPA